MIIISNPTLSQANIFTEFILSKDSKQSVFNYNSFKEIDLNKLSQKTKSTIPSRESVQEVLTTKIAVKKTAQENIKTVTYNPNNLRELSNLTAWQISKILEGTALEVLAEEYYEMEQEYNVNALFLIALNIEESAYGKSQLAENKNNLGGITSRYGGYAYFDNWEECLEYLANLLDKSYLTESGPYYYGTSIYDVNTKYCTTSTWSENINQIAYELIDKVGKVK